jgi:teichuronic acid biosynthesis glycosyltransferase TuaC
MLCQHRPDIVHAHMATPAGFVAVSLAKRMGVPCCLTLHGLDVTDYPRSSKTIGRQTEWTLRSADRVIAVSRYIASAAASLARSERPIQVCYIGVDLQKFKPDLERRAAVRRQLGVADHVQILCLAARMVREKGGDVFSAAVAEVSRRGLDVAALLIGAGPKSDRLIASLVDRLGRHRVFAVRDIPNERMADYFAAADLLLHPSLEEGFGMVLLEAQACGLPIIAIDVGGVREAVDAGRSAWLLPAQASEGKLALALADAVGDLLLGRERMSQMARLGREFAVRNFEIGYVTQKLIRIYDELRSQ